MINQPWIQNSDGGGGVNVAVGELQNLCDIKKYLVFHKSILDKNEKKFKVYLNSKEWPEKRLALMSFQALLTFRTFLQRDILNIFDIVN
jgi:hypothetical protein